MIVPDTTWEIQSSISFELDTLFTLLSDYLPRASLSIPINQLFDAVPPEMASELQVLLGPGKHYFTLLFPAAYAARIEFEDDYARATLPIRQMQMSDVVRLTLERVAEQRSEQDLCLLVDPNLSPVDQMKQIQMELVSRMGKRFGYTPLQSEIRLGWLKADIERLGRFLSGGDLHAQFWHWLDRFYYQVYHPWRQTRQEQMATEAARARLALGVPNGRLPLDWLPQVSPLRTSHELTQAMQQNGLHVVFLVEPFEMPDVWLVLPQGLAITFAENVELYEHFNAFIEHLSERLKALADPTRLMIMRIIRNSPRDNTEIANFLSVSRPTVSIHARQMREAGLIHTYEDGRSVRHEVMAAEVRRLFHDLERFLDLPPEEPESGGTDQLSQ